MACASDRAKANAAIGASSIRKGFHALIERCRAEGVGNMGIAASHLDAVVIDVPRIQGPATASWQVSLTAICCEPGEVLPVLAASFAVQGRTRFDPSAGSNIAMPPFATVTGTSFCSTSQCSASCPPSIRKMSTTTCGTSDHPRMRP